MFWYRHWMSCSPPSWNAILTLGCARDIKLWKDRGGKKHCYAHRRIFFTAELHLLIQLILGDFFFTSLFLKIAQTVFSRIYSYSRLWQAGEQLLCHENQSRHHSLWMDNWWQHHVVLQVRLRIISNLFLVGLKGTFHQVLDSQAELHRIYWSLMHIIDKMSCTPAAAVSTTLSAALTTSNISETQP